MAQKILIVGAHRGIGLNFAKSFAALSWDVTGSVRPQSRDDPSLEATGAKILEIDFLDESTIVAAVEKYADGPLDVLVNVRGSLPDPKAWQDNTAEFMIERFSVMAVGPFLTTKYFLPNLEKSPNGRIINISSTFGSVTYNKIGTCMAYRVAEAALNQVTMTLAKDFEKQGRKVTAVNIEPGFVATRLTAYDFVDDMDTSIAGLVKGIQSITSKDNGSLHSIVDSNNEFKVF